MKVAEAFEGVDRLWEELSIITVVHCVALALAIFAGLISLPRFAGPQWFGSELTSLQKTVKPFGFELSSVALIAASVYVILFQKFSAGLVRLPLFRLSYSQTGLWRAGKCFEELRQLVHWFEGYTASTALTDLEVTLQLAIAQNAKDFPEHYQELIADPLKQAEMWAKYYSGFLALALAFAVFAWRLHPTLKDFVGASGLVLSAIFARCGWEAQVEQAVKGRLRFAIDCGIISGFRRRESKVAADSQTGQRDFYAFLLEAYPPLLSENATRLYDELQLAVDLLKLPPPFLPYQTFWFLHLVRQFRPFANVGTIRLIQNQIFCQWLTDNGLEDLVGMHYALEPFRELKEMIEFPEFTANTGTLLKLLRTSTVINVSSVFFPTTFLVDTPRKYKSRLLRGNEKHGFPFNRLDFQQWLAEKEGHKVSSDPHQDAR
jgi:hypothetical protein